MENTSHTASTRGPDGGHLAAAGLGAGSAGTDYSTLEVVPSSEYEKEVVHQPQTAFQDANSKYLASSQSGTAWSGGSGMDTVRRKKILGLKRRTFFIVAWAASLLLAIAVGLGAGLGATMGKKGNDAGAAAGATTAAAGAGAPGGNTTPIVQSLSSTRTNSASSAISGPSDASTAAPATSPPAPTPTIALSPSKAPATRSSTSSPSAPQNSAPVKIGGVGGRCVNQWGGDCICLDEGICRNKWKGTPYTGFPGNYPCPNDPDNIMACVVKPCLGKTEPAQCLWREACGQLAPGMIASPAFALDGCLTSDMSRNQLGSELPRRRRLCLLCDFLVRHSGREIRRVGDGESCLPKVPRLVPGFLYTTSDVRNLGKHISGLDISNASFQSIFGLGPPPMPSRVLPVLFFI